jgi:hypothetical protein
LKAYQICSCLSSYFKFIIYNASTLFRGEFAIPYPKFDVVNIDSKKLSPQISDSHKCGDHTLWEKKKEEIKLLTRKIVGERLTGQIDLPESMWQEEYHFITCCYRRNVNCADFEKGVQPNDVSIIYNLQNLQARHEVADEEATCTGLAYLKLKKEGRTVFLHAPNSSGPEISLKMIKQMLQKLESEKWTLQTLKEKIPEECKSPINCEESCPGIEVEHQEAIKMFEVRYYL